MHSPSDDIDMLAALTDEMTRRLESGDPISVAEGMEQNPACAGPIRQLLPTLRAMVSLGEQIAREQASRIRLRKKDRS